MPKASPLFFLSVFLSFFLPFLLGSLSLFELYDLSDKLIQQLEFFQDISVGFVFIYFRAGNETCVVYYVGINLCRCQ